MPINSAIRELEFCPLCGGTGFRALGLIDSRRLARCRACGHEFAVEYDLDEIGASYTRDYYRDPEDPRIAFWAEKNKEVWEGICAAIEGKAKVCDTLVDIGSGTGGFLKVAAGRFAGAKLAAVESDPVAESVLRKSFPGSDVVSDVKLLPEPYWGDVDVVTLLQTLEHLEDLSEICRDILRLLRPGGLLIVTVPNKFSYRVLLEGTKETYCYSNSTHLHFFSWRTLSRLLRSQGFERIERLTQWGFGGQAGMSRNLAQWLLRKSGISSEIRCACFKPIGRWAVIGDR